MIVLINFPLRDSNQYLFAFWSTEKTRARDLFILKKNNVATWQMNQLNINLDPANLFLGLVTLLPGQFRGTLTPKLRGMLPKLSLGHLGMRSLA